MVLPDRIELSASPLPMGCSTTELRQHPGAPESGALGLSQRDVPAATGAPLP